MPELPDICAYVEALDRRVRGTRLARLRVASPFLLRSVDPPPSDLEGRTVHGVQRLGKRIVFELDEARFIVLHLMIAGRLQWRESGAAPPRKGGLAAFDFEGGTLVLTEAGSTRRASLHLVRGAEGLTAFDRGGLEVLDCDLDAFATRLRSENHTLKRSLTDPRLFSGIGNAYSDEILHAARLSPLALTARMKDEEVARLFAATRDTLTAWVDRLRAEAGNEFPTGVTAFRPAMAVHGRFGQPCPVCGAPVQRIVYAENECNYCANCQTGGTVLADRALSRLLNRDWPRSLDDWETLKIGQSAAQGRAPARKRSRRRR